MRLIGLLIYGIACVACLVFVATPLAVVGAGVGLGAGLVVAVVLAGVVLLGGPRFTVLRTPEQVRDGLLPGRVGARFVRRDRAWPQYFAAQVALDARAIIERARTSGEQLWARPAAWLRASWFDRWWWPLFVPVVAVQATASTGIAVGIAAVLVLVAGVAAAAWTVGLPVVYALRGVDAGWREVRRSRASCSRCFALAAVPAYRCLGPHPDVDRDRGDDLHRDLRPGRLGVLWRRCACGSRLPTTVLRAAFSRRLQACCPSCGEALFAGAGVVPDVRMPVFGAASSGKTQLIMAALVGLHAAAREAGIDVSLPDERGRRTYAVYSDLVRRGLSAPKTDAATPVAITVRLAKGVDMALLHVFDAAGESLVDPEQNARLSYLDHAEALTFVLDPFSIRRIRDLAGERAPDVLAAANRALHDPEDSYNATAQRLRDYGVRTDRQRLAFVVSKTDLLAKVSAGPDSAESDVIRQWLSEQGLDNLVVAAERDFREVRFFLVCGRDTGPEGPYAVLRWVLRKGWGTIG